MFIEVDLFEFVQWNWTLLKALKRAYKCKINCELNLKPFQLGEI